jgi:hypothetical protein
MASPQLSKCPALLKEIRSQICPLHLLADLVVERQFSFQRPLGMNLGDQVHERRSETMHRRRLPKMSLSGAVGAGLMLSRQRHRRGAQRDGPREAGLHVFGGHVPTDCRQHHPIEIVMASKCGGA